MRLSALVLLLGVFGCSPNVRTPTLPLTTCWLDDAGIQAQCGALDVFEDREAATGRKISLKIAVVPALAPTPEPDPLFLLVGGPGQSATRSGAMLSRIFSDVRKTRDIVLVDQRGTGESNPLNCVSEDHSIARLLDEEFDAEELRRCLEGLDAAPEHYTTREAMDDLDDVRAALGYDRINLWGGSYGTRAALTYMRQHPEHVRRVVLDGPAPTDMKLPLYAGRDAQRALDHLFDRCKADDACAAAFGDPASRLAELLAALDEQPREVELRHPRTGTLERITLTSSGLAAAVRAALYIPPMAALVPLSIDEAAKGNWTPILALLVGIADGIAQDMAHGMFLSVVCAEDVPRITDAEYSALTTGNFVGELPVKAVRDACGVWPSTDLPDTYFTPITPDHPTLVLTGEVDPVVPPSWGELVASRLPNGRHFVVRGASHGVSSLPCVTRAIAKFLSTEKPADVTVDCATAEPPFFTTLAGGSP